MDRRTWIRAAEVDRMVELYTSGLSSYEVAEELRRCARGVRNHLKERGVLRDRRAAIRLASDRGRSRKHALDTGVFEKLDAARAWVLGLIIGDGHVRRWTGQQYWVELVGTEQVCSAASKILGFGGRTRKHSHSQCYVVRWCSYRIVESLERLGVKSGNKARVVGLPDVSEKLMPHVLRGLWDADGTWVIRGNYIRTRMLTASCRLIDELEPRIGGNRNDKPLRRNGKVYPRHVLELRAAETRRFRAMIYAGSQPATRCARKYAQAWSVTGGALFR